MSFSACFVTAFTIAGFPWPKLFTPIPEVRSTCFFPSASQSVAPFPWSRTMSNRPYVCMIYSESFFLISSAVISFLLWQLIRQIHAFSCVLSAKNVYSGTFRAGYVFLQEPASSHGSASAFYENMVPTPSFVSSSIKIECGTRPS